MEYFKKAYANSSDADPNKELLFKTILRTEAFKELYTPSMRHIKSLVQLDDEPNWEIYEAKWEIYKISLSLEIVGEFTSQCGFHIYNCMFRNAFEMT